jgi:hypothetical protein
MRRVAATGLLAALCAACAPLPPVVEVEPPKAPRITIVAPKPDAPDPQAEAGPPVWPPSPSPPPPPPPPVPEDVKIIADLVVATQRFATLSPDDQKRDYNAANQSYTRERTLPNRLRVALMLSVPGSAVQDDTRALALLDGLPPGTNPLRQFAGFVQAQVAERTRTARRADQLKEQLDALRAVERSIIERGDAPAPRKP